VTKASGYRADIDGLRAVAILPVLLFHAGVAGFSGGFVGVDIFFVISGYLITGIIAREIDEGRFSILKFYERRARRIMPALLPTIAVVLVVAAWLYLPSDFPSVPRSALAATWFLSNVSFFAETGYFQGGAETKPLLHTWSLAIEEQFYIGFPILLMLVARHLPRWRKPVVLGIALFSFAIAWWTQAKGDGFAFYLLPPRAWELFTGALLALGAVPPVRMQGAREAVALVGLAMIAVAVFAYDRHTVFPGVTALLPVLGAAALIHCAPGTVAGRLLATRPLVAVGLISYSLYLCHWPLIVFVEYAQDARLSGWQSLAVILAAFAIATLSWWFVERPFRDRSRFGRRAIFTLTGGCVGGDDDAGRLAAAFPAGGRAHGGRCRRRQPLSRALPRQRRQPRAAGLHPGRAGAGDIFAMGRQPWRGARLRALATGGAAGPIADPAHAIQLCAGAGL
jgi:peptidoglycan/LPS O-acetylase OafA/YrhL